MTTPGNPQSEDHPRPGPSTSADAQPHWGSPADSAQSKRSIAPDVARGMMLLFIALANVSWFLWDQPAGFTSAHPTDGTVLDRILQAVMIMTVDGRAYPLFAFLFGYGIIQFINSRLKRGFPQDTIRRMLRRRHWWLLLFGALHAGLLFFGDVLGAYAVTALLLVWLFLPRKDITLWVWSSIGLGLLAISAALSVVGGLFVAALPPEVSAGEQLSIADTREIPMAETNYLVSIVARLGIWAVLTPFQVLGLAIPICVLLGWLAARRRLLEDPAKHRKTLIRIAVIGIPIGWLGGAPQALVHTGIIGLADEASFMFSGLAQFTGIFCGIGYAALFGLIGLRWQDAQKSPAPLRALSAVGQKSLTFYLWQAVIFAPLMAAWGFGVGAHVNTAAALGIALVVWLAGVGIAAWLDRTGRRGPAELGLRRLTYGKDDRLQRVTSTSTAG